MKSKTYTPQTSIPLVISMSEEYQLYFFLFRKNIVSLLYQVNKGNNKLTEHRTILQRESQNS